MSGIKHLTNMSHTRRVVQSRSRPCPATTGSSEVPVHLYTPVCTCAHSVHLTCAHSAHLCTPVCTSAGVFAPGDQYQKKKKWRQKIQ